MTKKGRSGRNSYLLGYDSDVPAGAHQFDVIVYDTICAHKQRSSDSVRALMSA